MGKATSTLKWIVMTTKAHMPSSCWGAYNYRNIGLIELNRAEALGAPKMLSDRAKGINRIIDAWYGVHCGETRKSKGVRIIDAYICAAHEHNQMVRTLREMNQ